MNYESSSTLKLRIQQVNIRNDWLSNSQCFCCISTKNILCRLEQCLTEGFLHITIKYQSFKRLIDRIQRDRLNESNNCSILGQSDTTIRQWWKEWVNNGRYQDQNGSGWPRTTVQRENRSIVWAAVTVAYSSLRTINCLVCTHVSNMTFRTWLR